MADELPPYPVLLPPADQALTLTPGTYSQLVEDTLGPLGPGTDELDAAIAAAQDASTAFEADLPNLDVDVDALDAITGEVAGVILPDVGGALGAANDYVTGGDSIFPDISAGVPQLGTIPLQLPGGQPPIVVGGPPEQGGTPSAGGAPYVLHWPVSGVGAFGLRVIGTPTLSGPNPPFAGLQGFDVETNAAGQRQAVALININPAHHGTFQATLSYTAIVTFTGITTPVNFTVGITVLVQ